MGQKLKFNSGAVVTGASESHGKFFAVSQINVSDWILVPLLRGKSLGEASPFLEIPFPKGDLGEGSYESLAVNTRANV